MSASTRWPPCSEGTERQVLLLAGFLPVSLHHRAVIHCRALLVWSLPLLTRAVGRLVAEESWAWGQQRRGRVEPFMLSAVLQ